MRPDENPRTHPLSARFSIARTAASIAVAAAVVLVSGCGDSPDAMLAKAKDLIAKKDRKGAEIELKSLLQKKDTAEARYLLGTVHAASGDLVSAEKEYKRAIDEKMDPEKVLPAYLDTLSKLGKVKEVVELGSKANLSDPEAKAQVLTLVARAQAAQNQMNDAAATLATALSVKPDFVPAKVIQISMQAAGGDIPGAETKIDKILSTSPQSPDALSLKGDLEISRGHLREARDLYAKAVAADPQDRIVRIKLVGAEIDLKDYPAAQKALDELKPLTGPAPVTMYMQAQINFRQGKLDAARDAILVALRGAPDHLPSLALGAQIYLAQHTLEQAETLSRKVVDGAPKSPIGYRLLAATLLAENSPDKALAAAQSGIDLGIKDAPLYGLAGEAALRVNEPQKALKFFESAGKINPNTPGSLTGTALAHMMEGNKDQGIQELEAAGRALSSDIAPELQLFMAHMRDKQFDKALADAARIETKQPGKPFAENLKGTALAAKGDTAGARAAFVQALTRDPKFFLAAANLATLDLRDNKPEDAKKRFTTLLEKDPKSVPAMLAIAQLEQNLALGDRARKQREALSAGGAPDPKLFDTPAGSPEALKWLKKAHETDKTSVPALLALTSWYAGNGQAKDAIPMLEDAVAASPANVTLLDALGTAYLRSGQPDQAMEQFAKVVQLKPDSAEVQFRMGGLQAMRGDANAAVSYFRKAVELDPKQLAPRVELAEMYARTGKQADARRLLAGIQKDFPKSVAVPLLEGDIYVSERKFDEAAASFRRASAIDHSTGIRIRAIEAVAASGKAAEAESQLRKLLKDLPDDMVARNYAAQFFTRTGRWADAADNYQVIVAKQPANGIAWNNLAWAQNELKDPKALDSAEKAAQFAPRAPAVLDTLGVILVARGQTERGVQTLKQAVELAPKVSTFRLHLAQALIKSGDKARAKDELDTLLNAEPKGPVADKATELRKGL